MLHKDDTLGAVALMPGEGPELVFPGPPVDGRLGSTFLVIRMQAGPTDERGIPAGEPAHGPEDTKRSQERRAAPQGAGQDVASAGQSQPREARREASPVDPALRAKEEELG